MNRTKRLIATALCASMALSTCSCSKKFENNVIDAADKLGGYIVDRNYNKLEKMTEDGDDDIEDIFSMLTDTPEDKQQEARQIIASTLSYEVDEESFEGDFMGKEGSIDIVFTYVDYESVTEDGFFVDVDAFTEAIEDCDDTVEVTLTLDFIDDTGDCFCTNIDEISKLFPYADEEFNFALNPEDYAGGVSFYDLNDGNGYRDVSSILCELEIEGDGQRMDWTYYFKVNLDYVEIYVSDRMTASAGEPLVALYQEDENLESGLYTISFFTDSGVLLGMESVTVTKTEPTPSPTPTFAPDYSDETPNPGPYFMCPEDGIAALPETDITMDLPDNVMCYDSDTPEYASLIAGSSLEEGICFLACDPDETEYVMCVHFDGVGYDSDSILSSIDYAVSNQESRYLGEGDTVERSSQDFTVGDRTFTMNILRVEEPEGNVYYYQFGSIGDSDTAYMLIIGSLDEPVSENYFAGMTIG